MLTVLGRLWQIEQLSSAASNQRATGTTR